MTWLARTFEDWNDDFFLSAMVLASIGLALAVGFSASIPLYLLSEVFLSGSRWEYTIKIGGAVASMIALGPRLLRVVFPALIGLYQQKQSDRRTRNELGTRS